MPALSAPAESPAVRSPLVGWLAVVSVMMGIFAIVTAEILPIGLLAPMASTFGITEGIAGLMMTVPGLVAAAAAPLVTVSTARLDRRLMLGLLMALLAVSDAVCAVAADYRVVLAARVLVGFVIGGFWSIGAGLAGRLVERRHVPRATAVIFSAVPLGSVLGVPAGTFLGDVAGWRAAFGCLGALTVIVLLALVGTLPRLPVRQATRLGVLRAALRVREVRIGLVVTVLVVLAHFGTYTYVTPFLLTVTGLSLGVVGTLLLVYGTAGIVGTVVAGSAVARRPRATFGVAAGLVAAATLLLPVSGDETWGAVALLVVWGLGYGAVPVCSQAWTARSASSPEAATVLFTSCFQATIAVGALVGGRLLDASSVSVVMQCGGVVAVAAVAVLTVAGRTSRPGGT